MIMGCSCKRHTAFLLSPCVFCVGENMKYIIMAGGEYPKWETPRQLIEIYGEPIIARTIRMLKELGVNDISISTNNEAFRQFGVPILQHDNDYNAIEYNNSTGYWCNAFFPTDEPTCYLFGDVVYSDFALQVITEYETDSIMLFGSKAPFAPCYPKFYIEPFAFKVADTDRLKWAIKEVKRLDSIGAFHRRPIAWEVWNVICGTDPNTINNSYVAINDYTCDIDYPHEIDLIKRFVKQGGSTMAKKAETTKATKAKPKKQKSETMEYKGQTFDVLERQDGKVKLTDGIIHFWVKDVKA